MVIVVVDLIAGIFAFIYVDNIVSYYIIIAYVGMRIEVEGGKRTKEEEREGGSDIVYTYMLR